MFVWVLAGGWGQVRWPRGSGCAAVCVAATERRAVSQEPIALTRPHGGPRRGRPLAPVTEPWAWTILEDAGPVGTWSPAPVASPTSVL